MIKKLSHIVAIGTSALLILLLPLSSGGEILSGSIARMRTSEGNVYVRAPGGGDWIEAQGNMPLSSGTDISTGSGGFAEIEFSGNRYVRLREQSMLKVVSIGNDVNHLKFINGGVYVSSLVREGPSIIIETQRGTTAQLLGRGSFRIDWDTRQGTGITVREGNVEISGITSPKILNGGETAWVDGNMVIATSLKRDGWDEFISRRDGEIAALSTTLSVDEEIPGRYDLAGYGEWVRVPEYGRVWRPFVSAGWAPFRYGRWTLMGTLGWTWVSYEPWGWVPYHYGSWVTLSSYGWVWVPVPRYTYWYPSRVRIGYRNRHVHITPLRPGQIYRAPPRRLRHRRYRPLFNRRVIAHKKVNPFRIRRRVIYGNIVPKIRPSRMKRHTFPSRKSIEGKRPIRKRPMVGKKPLVRKKRNKNHLVRTRERKILKNRYSPYTRNVEKKGGRYQGEKKNRWTDGKGGKRKLFQRKKRYEGEKRREYSENRSRTIKRKNVRKWRNSGSVKRQRRGSFARNFMRRW